MLMRIKAYNAFAELRQSFHCLEITLTIVREQGFFIMITLKIRVTAIGQLLIHLEQFETKILLVLLLSSAVGVR